MPALFWTDFGGDTLGQTPAGWTERGLTATVESSGIAGSSGRFLQLTLGSGGSERFVSFDAVDNEADVEIVARVAFATTSTDAYVNSIYLRAAADANVDSYVGVYVLAASGDYVNVEKNVDNDYTSFEGAGMPTIDPDTWYRLRFRANGSVLQLSTWLDNASEPSGWTVDTTDPLAELASGLHGLGAWTGSQVLYVDWVGIATEGATAPTEAVGAPAELTATVAHGLVVGVSGAVTADPEVAAPVGDPETFEVVNLTSGRALSWSASPSEPSEYRVFRRTPSTGAAFDPDADSPHATGITATTYLDADAITEADYDYQVFGWLGAVNPELGMYRGWGNADGIDTFGANNGLTIVYGHEFGDHRFWSYFRNGTNFATWDSWVGASSGRRFTYSCPLLTGDSSGSQAQRYADLVAGVYDNEFISIGQAFENRPNLRNAIVRLGWEFNGMTFPWQVPPNDQTTLDNYKAGFVRAAGLLRDHAPNLQIEWCPNIQLDYTNRTFEDMVPDPSAFEFVGLGQYDYYWPGGSPSAAQREDWLVNGATGVNGYQDQVDLANDLGRGKAFTEYGLWRSSGLSGGGDRPAYIDLVADWMLANNYAYHVYNNVTADGGHDLDDYPNARARFTERFGS